jgi:hypothetical protein
MKPVASVCLWASDFVNWLIYAWCISGNLDTMVKNVKYFKVNGHKYLPYQSLLEYVWQPPTAGDTW